MRDFTDMTVVPGSRFVAVDGEGYFCDGFPAIMPNVKGSVREVPGDRILAMHWHGKHGHGHVEGFGAAEGSWSSSAMGSAAFGTLRGDVT
jgi:hypothetical protein